MAMSKIKALQMWCKRALEGYRDVNITDMTTSWRSGLAFCAMIHKYRPDLMDYDALDKENVYDNNKLAFDVAEKELNIAALLEAADMVAMKVPDRLSIITYVAQYHNYFKDKPVLGGPGISVANKSTPSGGVKRHHEGSEPQSRPEVKRFTPSHENKQDKPQEKLKQRQASMGETCQICRNKVYLLERHIEDSKLYHRSCYRRSDMSPASKVYAKPSVLSVKDDKQDIPVNGMTNLGKGFAAPSRSEPERSRSPTQSTARVALNMNSGYKSRINQEKQPESRTKSTDSEQTGNYKSNTKSALDRIEEKSKSDWKSNRSHSPRAERKPFSSSAGGSSGLHSKSSESSDKKVTDKWPPLKDDKLSSKGKSEISAERKTPVPKPRQSLLKEEDKGAKSIGKLEDKKLGRKVEDMEVDEPKSGSRLADKKYTSDLETRKPRNLPLALQSPQNNKPEEKPEPTSSKKNEEVEVKDAISKSRLYVKKNERKLNGSTEKLNKTVGERIKESKEKARLKNHEEKVTSKSEEKPEKLSTGRSKSVTPPASSPDDTGSPPPLPRSTPPELTKSPPLPRSTHPELPKSPPLPRSTHPELPKSPPLPRKAPQELTKSPPLPRSTHPELPKSPPLPRKTPKELTKSPALHPTTPPSTAPPRPARNPTKPVTSPIKSTTPVGGPPKPPRAFLTEDKSSDSAEHAINKASQWTKGSEPVAVMVYPGSPTTPEESEQQLFSGLLKSLANVRQRQPDNTPNSEQFTETKSAIVIPPRSYIPNSNTDKNVLSNNLKNSHSKAAANSDNKNTGHSYLSQKQTEKVTNKTEVIDTTPIPAWQKEVSRRKADKDAKSNQRPKSTAAILDYHHGKDIHVNSEKAKDKNRVVQNSVQDTTPTPAWQKEARRRKENGKKSARPKSMEVLSDENGDFCVGEDNLKVLNLSKDLKKRENKKSLESRETEESVLPDWQKEAQKRIEERKGNYVDPEKKRIVPERPERTYPDKSKQKHIEIVSNGQVNDNKNVTKTVRTKVSPGVKFNFDINSLDSSSSDERDKKGRQPPPRPNSPPPVNRAQKNQRYSTGSKSTPPKAGMSPGKLTPMEIQRQLMDIDSKLTDLELKGRRLEDSIRNAQEDEEDALMIDWFLLVSQKNELVRQEVDLIYASRENELESEQDDVQDQLRRLLDKPKKTKEDKEQEQYLLEKLLDIVDQRSQIVDSIDDDKHRYEEEDREIAIVLEKKANSRTQERLL